MLKSKALVAFRGSVFCRPLRRCYDSAINFAGTIEKTAGRHAENSWLVAPAKNTTRNCGRLGTGLQHDVALQIIDLTV